MKVLIAVIIVLAIACAGGSYYLYSINDTEDPNPSSGTTDNFKFFENGDVISYNTMATRNYTNGLVLSNAVKETVAAPTASTEMDECLENMYIGSSGSSMYFLISSQDCVVSAILASMLGTGIMVDYERKISKTVEESITDALEYAVEQSTSRSYTNSIERGISTSVESGIYAEVSATASYSAFGAKAEVGVKTGVNLTTGIESSYKAIGSFGSSSGSTLSEKTIQERSSKIINSVEETYGFHQVLEDGVHYAYVMVSKIYLIEEIKFNKNEDGWVASEVKYHIIIDDEDLALYKSTNKEFNALKNTDYDCRLTEQQVDAATAKWASTLDDSPVIPILPTYKVIFYGDENGSIVLEEFTVNAGDMVSVNSPFKTNHNFIGWSTEKGSTEIIDNFPQPITSNTEYYPIFEKDKWADYTKIHNQSELSDIRNNLGGKYVLANSIDLSGNWLPIGDSNGQYRVFNGILDGNGYTISNLNIVAKPSLTRMTDLVGDYNVSASGLFAIIGTNAEISNIVFENVYVKPQKNESDDRMGLGVVAGISRGGYIHDIILKSGTVTTPESWRTFVMGGGILGIAGFNTRISDCINTNVYIRIDGNDSFGGGILGWSVKGGTTISHCANQADVNSRAYGGAFDYKHADAGGIIGSVGYSGADVSYCFSDGRMDTNRSWGYMDSAGIIGRNDAKGSSKITHCIYASGKYFESGGNQGDRAVDYGNEADQTGTICLSATYIYSSFPNDWFDNNWNESSDLRISGHTFYLS